MTPCAISCPRKNAQQQMQEFLSTLRLSAKIGPAFRSNNLD